MKITNVTSPPTSVSIYESWDGPGAEDIEDKLTPGHVQDVVEIFQTPLTGHYNWDYSSWPNPQAVPAGQGTELECRYGSGLEPDLST